MDNIISTPQSFKRRDPEPQGSNKQRDQVITTERNGMSNETGRQAYEYDAINRDRGQDGYRPDPRGRHEGYNQGQPRQQADERYEPSPRPRPSERYNPAQPGQRQHGAYEQSPRSRTPERYGNGRGQAGYEQSQGAPDPYSDMPTQERFDEQRRYMGGRPDLGPVNPNTPSKVPYPQEPDRRRREDNTYIPPPEVGYPQEPDRRRREDNTYIPPPEVGFDPYKEPEPPKDQSKPTVQDIDDPNPGWLMLMRFHKDGLYLVQRALTMSQKHIESDGGRILGIARPNCVRIQEGGDSWVTFGKMKKFAGRWDVSRSPADEDTNYCVLVIFYQSLSRAIEWLDRDHQFKQKDFPANHPLDCIVLPVHGSANTPYRQTLVMTEYAKIADPDYFRIKYSIPTEDLMRNRYKACPYVVKACSVATEDQRQRVAKHLRGSWIKRNSVITVSLFESMAEAYRYFNDTEYIRAKECQDRVSAPTTVVMGVEDWHEPYKNVP